MSNAGAFAKIASASATGGGNNVRDGIYKFIIEKVHLQDGHSGQCFIAEFRVADAQANGATDERGNQIVPNTPGSTCSMVCNLTKHESAAGNAKAFVVQALAGLGVTEDKITPEVMGWVCGPDNPLRGVAVIDETYRTVNKGRANPANAGKPLTLNKWKPVGQTEADVEAARAFLTSTAPRADVTPAAIAPVAVATPVALAAATVAPALNPLGAITQPAATPAAKPMGILGGILGGK